MIVFVDTHVFLDILFNNAPFADISEQMLNVSIEQGHKIYIPNTTALEIKKALSASGKDIEDAYQYYSVLKISRLKYLITRNTKEIMIGLQSNFTI